LGTDTEVDLPVLLFASGDLIAGS